MDPTTLRVESVCYETLIADNVDIHWAADADEKPSWGLLFLGGDSFQPPLILKSELLWKKKGVDFKALFVKEDITLGRSSGFLSLARPFFARRPVLVVLTRQN